jgi:hypothetical protein
MTCPNCRTLSCYVCREIITGYGHFDEVRHIFFSSHPLQMRVEPSHDPVSLNGQNMRVNACFGIKSRNGIRKRYVHHHTSHSPRSCAQCCYQVEEAQKRAIEEYRKEHPEVGEDVLQVEPPKATGETSGSRNPRPQAPPMVFHNPIEPLHRAQNPDVNPYRRLLELARQEHIQDLEPGVQAAPRLENAFQRAYPVPEIPELHLPQPRANMPNPRPVGAAQNLQEDLQRHHEELWVQQRRLVQQQRVLAGRFAGGHLGDPGPAVLLDDLIPPIPRRQRNRAGAVRLDPMDRGRVDQWRRGVPEPQAPGEGAVL